MITAELSLTLERQYFQDKLPRLYIDRRNDTTIYATIQCSTSLQEDLTNGNLTIYFSGANIVPFSLTTIGGGGLDVVTSDTNKLQVKGLLENTQWTSLSADEIHTIKYEIKLTVDGKEMYIDKKREFYIT